MKEKILILLVSMALLVGILSGCTETTPPATNEGPTAAFTYPEAVYNNTECTFTDASTDDTGVETWSWDFDADGTEDSSEQNPTHTFTEVGDHEVTLTVTDAEGETSTATETITVGYKPATVAITVPETVTNNTEATFEATVTLGDGTVEDTAYAWEVDGVAQGEDVNTSSLTVTFTTVGDHTVKVTVTDSNDLTGSDEQTVTVAEAVTE